MRKKSGKSGTKKAGLTQDILAFLQSSPDRKYNYKQIARGVRADSHEQRMSVMQALEALASEGLITETSRGKYKLKVSEVYITGVLDMTRSGSAYIVSEDVEEDVYVSPKNVGNALHGDTVRVFLYAHRRGKKPSGEVVEVLRRSRTEFPGIVEVFERYAFLVPDDPKMMVDIYIPLNSLKGAVHGQKAVARITDWPRDATSPFGEITAVLGMPGEHRVEMLSILSESGFPTSFPEAVLQAAGKVPETVHPEEAAKRRDFRNITTFTIDPEDAKDFDDALSFRALEDGLIEVGVHIADVSHYVEEGSALDREAARRGTSVYLVDRVIPMLPEKLSNDICSLRPNEDRLCFAAVFELDRNAEVRSLWIGKTIIFSNRRFSYEEVQDILDNQRSVPFSSELKQLNHLAHSLRDRRMKNGAIAFDKLEVRFRLDENHDPKEVYFKHSLDAHKLIEEFMLLANKAVAEFVGKKRKKGEKEKTFVYRVHDLPDAEKLGTFVQFVRKFGYQVKTSNPRILSQSLNQLLREIKGSKEENMIEQLAIRTMAKAFYTTDNFGHYGLAFPHYTHFTSPIRRYPDVIVHRLLSKYLNGGHSVSSEEIEKLCGHSSEMERKAAEAERDSVKYYQVQFLKGSVGKVFDGIISGVTEWGLYVELTDNKCEGMIRLKDIDDDYYMLDEDNYRIVGRRGGRSFQLGDELRVELKNADPVKRQIDFTLSD